MADDGDAVDVDDDDDDDEPKRKPKPEGGGRMNGSDGPAPSGGGNNKKKGGGNRPRFFAEFDKSTTDLSTDPRFLNRFSRTLIGQLGILTGEKLGSGPLKDLLDKGEDVFGTLGLTAALAGAAALIGLPDALKKFMAQHGVRTQYLGLGDDFIDDAFEGLTASRLMKGKLTAQDADRVLGDALRKLEGKAKRAQAEPVTFQSLTERLTNDERILLAAHLMNLEQLDTTRSHPLCKRWDGLRDRIKSLRLLREAIALPTTYMMVEHLELYLGKVTVESAPTRMIHKVQKAVKKVNDGLTNTFGSADDNARLATVMRTTSLADRLAARRRGG